MTRLSAHELAERIGLAWRDPMGPAFFGFSEGLCARRIRSGPGEVASPPSDANILSLVVRGEARHTSWRDGRKMIDGIVPSDSLNIVPAEVTPRSVIRDALHLTHFYVPAPALDNLAARELGVFRRVELFDPLFSPDPVLLSITRAIDHMFDAPYAGSELELDALGHALMMRLLLRWSNARGAESSRALPPRAGVGDRRVRRLMEWMDARLGEPVTLRDLSEEVQLAPSHLIALFRTATGLPPHRWLLARRIERSCDLLQHSDLPITDIALRCGFSSGQHFSTAFREARGVTPSAFRNARAASHKRSASSHG